MTKPRCSPDDRIQLRSPDRKKSMPRVAKSSHALAHKTALAVLPKRAPGIALEDFDEMKTRLPKLSGWDDSTSAGWLAMAIKLDLGREGDQADRCQAATDTRARLGRIRGGVERLPTWRCITPPHREGNGVTHARDELLGRDRGGGSGVRWKFGATLCSGALAATGFPGRSCSQVGPAPPAACATCGAWCRSKPT